jgi:hypothetical protein
VTEQELVDQAIKLLEEKPDAPLKDRVTWAVVVGMGGDPDRSTTFGQVAEIAGCEIGDVAQALMAQREQWELDDETR